MANFKYSVKTIEDIGAVWHRFTKYHTVLIPAQPTIITQWHWLINNWPKYSLGNGDWKYNKMYGIQIENWIRLLISDILVSAASTIFMEGKETIWLRWIDDHKHSDDIELRDVGHIPNSGINLISIGHLLQAGGKVTGEMNTITVTYGDGDILVPFTTSFPGRNMYTLKASPVHSRALGTINYQTVHRHLGHPSKEVIRQAK